MSQAHQQQDRYTPCRFCGRHGLIWRKIHGQWRKIDPQTDKPHTCDAGARNAALRHRLAKDQQRSEQAADRPPQQGYAVTQQMLDAGAKILEAAKRSFTSKTDLLRNIYAAMREASIE